MRVLHVISGIDPAAGGPTAALCGMAEAQVRAGLDVTVLAPWHERGAAESLAVAAKLNERGVATRTFGPATRRGAHADMARHLDEAVTAADVVHIHALWEESQHLAAVTAQRRAKPYLFTPHGMLDPWNLSQGRWKKRLYLGLRLRRHLNRATALHATTEFEAQGLGRFGLKPAVFVEPLGIDFADFESLPDRREFHRVHPELNGARYVLYLGRLHHGKGLELLIPAFANGAPPEARLVIAGPDYTHFRRELDALIRASDLGGRVVFTGMLRGRDKLAALAGAEFLALPSFHENFGMSVVEALAAGRPVLVSDQVQLWREIAAAGVGAACPTTIDAVAGLLRDWLGDPARIEAAAARARPFARARYDWDVIARNWVGHYARVARSAGSTDAVPRRRVSSA